MNLATQVHLPPSSNSYLPSGWNPPTKKKKKEKRKKKGRKKEEKRNRKGTKMEQKWIYGIVPKF
jgi:hypothetical protein